MILIERPVHLTGKSNGSHGHWTTKAREAKAERGPIADEIDRQMTRLTPGKPAFALRRVKYWGKWRGLRVEKTKMVRELAPAWQSRLDAGIIVHLTRYAEKALDDDNLRRGFKHFRDGVADSFGIRDDDKRIRFEYADVRSVPSRITVAISWSEAP